MKLFKKIGIFILAISLGSCESFLQVEDVGRTSIPVFFKDMDGMRAALPGAYSKVYDFYDGHFFLYPDATGDLFNMSPSGESAKMNPQFNFNSTPQEEIGAVGYIWRDGYEAMANVNNIIEYHPILLADFPADQLELDRIKAEALFLRALLHFDLVRVYAQPYNFTPDAQHLGIPVLQYTPGPDENVNRSTVFEVYEQIESDLKEAEALFVNLPTSDIYHASGLAVKALMARVYLYMEDWSSAKEYADKVIDNTELAQGEDYLDMYRTVTLGEESIFRLNGNLKGSSIADYYTPAGPVGYGSQKLMELYKDSTDLRYELFDLTGGTNATLKYYIPNLSEEDRQIDLFVLRASEMHLIKAEAAAQLDLLSEAETHLKIIQARAYQLPASDIQLDYSSKSDLLDLIMDERAKELSFEGHRLFDLTRTKRDLERDQAVNSSVTKLQYPNPLFILPIPETEINANGNITQNPEY